MGQRLNIEIHNKGELLANCYYHWSAYTKSALILTKQVLKFIKENEDEYSDPLVLAVKALETTEAGVMKNDMEYLMSNENYSKYSYNPAVDRNLGLICVTKDGMENTRYWEEGRVTVYLDEEMVSFDVFFHTRSEEEYKADCEYNGEDAIIDSLVWDNADVKFKDFDNFATDVSGAAPGIKFRNGESELHLRIY